MGMFSWDCNGCGFSLRECRGCSVDNWMSKGVCLTPEGSRVVGHYNAYGQLGEYSLVDQIGKFAIYHHACWELAGKPEYDRQAHHSRDQGFCHQMHGQPLPKPTSPEWLHKGRMWNAIESVLQAYGQLLCDIHHDEAKALWNSLSPERQLVLSEEFDTAKNARKVENKAAWEAYLHSSNYEELSPEPIPDPTHYSFDGLNFDFMWLNHFIRMAKNDY